MLYLAVNIQRGVEKNRIKNNERERERERERESERDGRKDKAMHDHVRIHSLTLGGNFKTLNIKSVMRSNGPGFVRAGLTKNMLQKILIKQHSILHAK